MLLPKDKTSRWSLRSTKHCVPVLAIFPGGRGKKTSTCIKQPTAFTPKSTCDLTAQHHCKNTDLKPQRESWLSPAPAVRKPHPTGLAHSSSFCAGHLPVSTQQMLQALPQACLHLEICSKPTCSRCLRRQVHRPGTSHEHTLSTCSFLSSPPDQWDHCF